MAMLSLPTVGANMDVPFGGRKIPSWEPRVQEHYAQELDTTVKMAHSLAWRLAAHK